MRNLRIDDQQFGAKFGRHFLEFKLDPTQPAARQWFREHIEQIFSSPDKIKTGFFRGQGEMLAQGSHGEGRVYFFIKSRDVVVTDLSFNYVTILKDGVSNKRVIEARLVVLPPNMA